MHVSSRHEASINPESVRTATISSATEKTFARHGPHGTAERRARADGMQFWQRTGQREHRCPAVTDCNVPDPTMLDVVPFHD